ncbi:MAG: citramalate synthase [Verrucomicrobiota bacterium]|nr:citramalate synthase [Verrucomicrobiota bacterium]
MNSLTTLSPVIVYDTTLRDGTQGEGISLSVSGKLKLAEAMDAFGFDYIEGGWPGSNPRDMQFFREARQLRLSHAKLTAFGSTCRMGIKAEDDSQLRLLIEAETPVVTIFGKSWLLHVTEVLRTTPEENLRMIEDSVRYLVSQGREVIYDAEHFFDGYANNPEYALQTLAAAVAGGAGNLTLCDTNGGKLVGEFMETVRTVRSRFPGMSIGVHCHNDGGLGVALSLAGVEAGATMVQGTLNGFGERIGNANLTTIVPNLVLKMKRAVHCEHNLPRLRELSLLADDLANVNSHNKEPFVGQSAFAHKGGVHANAAQKVAHSYEHIQPELVGNRQRILLSDMAGGSSVRMKARELGIELDEKSPEMRTFVEELKRREFEGYEYENANASFEVLLNRHFHGMADSFKLIGYRVIVEVARESGAIVSEATVKLNVHGEVRHTVAEAQGPVAALDHALRKALEIEYPCLNHVILRDYKVRILERGCGTDSIVQVLVKSSDGVDSWWTTGAGTNVIEASWEALRDSLLYKLLIDRKKCGS